MIRKVKIGSQSFEALREGNWFYVDKTSFIKEWWENGDDVTLITRPCRFGKNLNMDMLKCFFYNRYAGDVFCYLSELCGYKGNNIYRGKKIRDPDAAGFF